MRQATASTPTSRWRLLILAALLALFSGCAAWPAREPVAAGDAVAVHFTCRAADGAILATTREAVAQDESEPLSHAFVPAETYQPARFTVGEARVPWQGPALHPLRDEIAYRLSGRVQGLRYGKRYRLSVASAPIEGLPDEERTIDFATTLHRKKQRTFPAQKLAELAGKTPAEGEILFEDQPVQWEVREVGPDSVTVRLRVQDGHAVKLPQGPAVIRDRGEHFELQIDTRVGELVRVGQYLGRVSAVAQGRLSADFSHPFGGQELACDVEVQSAPEAEPAVEQALGQAADGLEERSPQ